MKQLLTCVVALLLGCGASTTVDESATSGGGGSGGGGGEGGTDADSPCPMEPPCTSEAGCLATSPNNDCRSFECGLAEPCPSVLFLTMNPSVVEPAYDLQTPTALTCLFESLRDGHVGKYLWSKQSDPSHLGPMSGVSWTLHVNSESSVLTEQLSQGDLGDLKTTMGPMVLQDHDYWQSCLTASSPAAQIQCLEAATLPCE